MPNILLESQFGKHVQMQCSADLFVSTRILSIHLDKFGMSGVEVEGLTSPRGETFYDSPTDLGNMMVGARARHYFRQV